MPNLPEKFRIEKGPKGSAKQATGRFLEFLGKVAKRLNRLTVSPAEAGFFQTDQNDRITLFINKDQIASQDVPFEGSYDASADIATIGASRAEDDYKFDDTITLRVNSNTATNVVFKKTVAETVAAADGDFIFYELEFGGGILTAIATLKSSATNPLNAIGANLNAKHRIIAVLGKITGDEFQQIQFGDIIIDWDIMPIIVNFNSVSNVFDVNINFTVGSYDSKNADFESNNAAEINAAATHEITRKISEVFEFDKLGGDYTIEFLVVRSVDERNFDASRIKWFPSTAAGVSSDAATNLQEHHTNNPSVTQVLWQITFKADETFDLHPVGDITDNKQPDLQMMYQEVLHRPSYIKYKVGNEIELVSENAGGLFNADPLTLPIPTGTDSDIFFRFGNVDKFVLGLVTNPADRGKRKIAHITTSAAGELIELTQNSMDVLGNALPIGKTASFDPTAITNIDIIDGVIVDFS